MYASRLNKKNRIHKSKNVKSGDCIFPFMYKKKEHNKCLDTGNGEWCPTSLTKSRTPKTWGYCVKNEDKRAAEILLSMKKGGYRVLIPSKYFGTGGGCPLSYGLTRGFSCGTKKRNYRKKGKKSKK
jgi:hypothetical protein